MEVLPVEPFEDMSVTAGESLNTADEPEWMCEWAASGAIEMPIQCQIKALESTNLLEVVISYENNPKRITGKKKAEQAIHSAGDAPVNLTPTEKPKTGQSEASGNAVNPSSIPSEDGCTYDAEGNPTCAVQSEPWFDYIIPGFASAEYSNLTPEDKTRHLSSLETVASKPDCKTFTTAVLSNLKKTGGAAYETTDINELAKSIFNNPNNTIRMPIIWSHGLRES